MKFKAVFSSGGQTITNTYQVLSIQIVASDQEMKSRLKNPNEVLTNNKKDVIQQIIDDYPDAMDIELKLLSSDRQQSSNNDSGALLLLLAIIIGILFAPFLLTFIMFGKLMLKGVFKDACGYPEYKKFRKLWLILSYVWFVVCVALFIVFNAALHLNVTVGTIPFYALFFGNLVFIILAVVKTNKIKKAHKDDVLESPEETALENQDANEESGAVIYNKEVSTANEEIAVSNNTENKISNSNVKASKSGQQQQSNKPMIALMAIAVFFATVIAVFHRFTFSSWINVTPIDDMSNMAFIIGFVVQIGLFILMLAGLGFTIVKEYLAESAICIIGAITSFFVFIVHFIGRHNEYYVNTFAIVSMVLAGILLVIMIVCFVMCLMKKKKANENK